MIEFRVLYIDYKEDSRERDAELSKKKADDLGNLLLTEYDICPYVNKKIGSFGELVTMDFCVTDDKLIKKIFKVTKKSGPYSITIEWKEDA